MLKSSVQSKIHQTRSVDSQGQQECIFDKLRAIYLCLSIFTKQQKNATLGFKKNLWNANYMQGNHRNTIGKTKTSCHH